MTLKDFLIKIGGWRAPIYFGGAADVDRWKWLTAHAAHGPLRTLDAGSGLGAFSFHAAHLGNEVVAISFVSKNNRKARKRAALLHFRNVSFLDGDLRQLDQLAETLGLFDQIFCVEVIEHVRDDAKLLRDLAALLKPGGRLLLSTPYKFHHPLVDERISEYEDGGHVRFGYTAEELGSLLAGNGLEVVSTERITGVIPQQIDNLMRIVRRLTPHDRTLGWLVTFPFRILQPLDRPLTALSGWPHLSLALVALKRAPCRSQRTGDDAVPHAGGNPDLQYESTLEY